MYNKKTREGLVKIREGIDLLINAFDESSKPVTVANHEAVKAAEEREVSTPIAPEKNNTVKPKNATASFDKEDLDSMAYNDLKKLARDLGVSGAGARDAIIERILGINLNVDEDGEVSVADEPTTQPTEAPKQKKGNVKKLGKKTEVEEETEEPEVDPVYEQVLEVTEDMSIEDLGDILSEIGKSPKGKRQALIDKIYQAVKNGELTLDDDEDEEDTEEPDEEEADTSSEAETAEADEEDEDDGVNDPDNMTDARRDACEQYEEEITNDFKNGELLVDDVRDFCIEFYGEDNEDVINDLEEDDLLNLYIDAVKRMIDDEGELIEEGAYEVNGEYFCCGRALKYASETGKYICEMCGEEYDAE